MSEQQGDPITLQKLSNYLDEATKLKAELMEKKLEADDIQKQIDHKLGLVKSALKDAKLNSFRNSRGMVVLNKRWSCSVPKEPKKRKEFFNWLKEIGEFDQWITVNSQTLNSEYKKRYEAAAKDGELFQIPGVGDPVINEYCSLRKV